MSAAEHATEKAQTGSEYIVHHLGNLHYGEGFWRVNVDSVFFSVLLAVVFAVSFYLAARKATAGVPGNSRTSSRWWSNSSTRRWTPFTATAS